MSFKGLFAIVLMGAVACTKGDYSKVAVYGHAGNGLKTQYSPYIHNSLESIELALGTEGAEGVEIDVQLAADGDLWVFHDDYLQDESTGSGCINDCTADQLEGIRYKTLHQERVIRLSELNFEAYGGRTILIDARHYNACTGAYVDASAFVGRLKAIRDQYPGVHLEVLTRWLGWVEEFRQAGFFVYFEYEDPSEVSVLDAEGITYDGIMTKSANITKDEVATWHSNGKKVILFDIRAPKTTRKALKKLPDGIIVEDIKGALIEKS